MHKKQKKKINCVFTGRVYKEFVNKPFVDYPKKRQREC